MGEGCLKKGEQGKRVLIITTADVGVAQAEMSQQEPLKDLGI